MHPIENTSAFAGFFYIIIAGGEYETALEHKILL